MAGFFDPTDPTAGGLMNGFAPQQGMPGMMGMFANPQTAGLLGMASGLLGAAGASRLPVTNGAALANGFQGMQQGAGNALQMQMQMAKMQSQLNPFGVGFGAQAQPQGAPQLSAPIGAPVTGPANSGPMSGPSAGMGLMAGAGSPPVNPNDVAQSPAPSNGLAMFGGHTAQEVMLAGARLAAFGNPAGAEMMKIAAAADPSLSPTDITKMGTQGGMTPAQIQAANAAGVAKANYIAPVNARPGAILRDPLTMQPMAFNPNIPAGGTPVFDASGNVVGINQIPGAADITSAMAAAKAGGEGSVLPYSGLDAQGNPLPVTNRTQAATGQMPLPLRNNNPGAVSPGGSVAQYPNLQTGLKAMDDNLAGYAGQQGTGTLGGVITKWVGSAPNAPAYIKDVTARLGVGANQPVDLTNPAQRQAIATAIMLHENGPGAVFRPGQGGSGAASAPTNGGAIYAAPPMGATTAANASQGAPSKQMADAYGALSGGDANYQASRAALQSMLGIAQNQGTTDTLARMLPGDVATRINNDAAEYEKAHANFVSLQGKALGSSGTDASRATLEAAVPTFDKPQQAKIAGLTNQLQQLDLNHLKTQFLTPTYQQGNEKQYTALSAGFDQNIKPAMMPVLQMSGDQQRAAVQAAVKANPSLRQNFEWAFNNGLLK